MTNSSSSSNSSSGVNQDKQLLEARAAIKTDSLLMKKALVILGFFFKDLYRNPLPRGVRHWG